jgi:hypothetical protein
VSTIVFGIMLGSLGLVSGAATATSLRSQLTTTSSPAQQRALTELSTCLNSPGKAGSSTFNVLYLVDASASLKQTDPKNARAQILASSLQQLSKVRSDIKVNWAMSTFGDRYTPLQDWARASGKDLTSATKWIRATLPSLNNEQGTDWRLGLAGAKTTLARAPGGDGAAACSLLVWLTDGAIDTGSESKDALAISQLCGLPPSPKFPSSSTSAMDAIRASGTHVFGVLLKNDSYAYSPGELSRLSYMQPIVEGSGQIDPTAFGASGLPQFSCGQSPVPNNYAQGAFFEANDPLRLSEIFLEISETAAGGTPVPAPFEVEPGIAAFTVLTTSSNWSLTGPNSSAITPNTPSTDLVQISKVAGVSRTSVQVVPSDWGPWSVVTEASSKLTVFMYSGLSVKLAQGTLVAGQAGVVSGNIVQVSGKPVSLALYKSANLTIANVDSSGNLGVAKAITVAADGSFRYPDFMPVADSSLATFDVSLALITKKGTPLNLITVRQSIPVSPPNQFPTISPLPLTLSSVSGRGIANGQLTIKGPKDSGGKSGQVCFGDAKKIGDPVASRTVTWSVSGVRNNCISVGEGQKQTVTVAGKVNEIGDGNISYEMPIRFTSEASKGREIAQNLPMSFKVLPPSGTAWVEIVLMLLGLLLPLAFLYLLNFLTTKIWVGNDLRKAVLEVVVTPTGRILNQPGRTLDVPTSAYAPTTPMFATSPSVGGGTAGNSLSVDDASRFEFQTTQAGVRKFPEVNTGASIDAILPWVPFKEPYFAVRAPQGHRVLTMFRSSPLKNGIRGYAPSTLSDLSFLLFADSDLRIATATENIPARLVVFLRNDVMDPLGRIRERLSDISVKPGVREASQRLVAQSIDETHESKEKTSTHEKRNGKSREKSPKFDNPKPPAPRTSLPQLPPVPGSTRSYVNPNLGETRPIISGELPPLPPPPPPLS